MKTIKKTVEGWLQKREMKALEAQVDKRSWSYLEECRIESDDISISSSDLRIIVESLAANERDAALTAFLGRTITPWSGSNIGTLMTAINPELAEKALFHFIWQVKRKMAGLPVENHMMVILRGAQRSGKSTFVNKLLAGLPAWAVTKFRLNELNQLKGLGGIAGKYVAFADELEGAKQTDLNSLKGFLTADTVDYRPLYTNARTSQRQNVTAIGCTNRPVAEQLNDETGMRRIWEIECHEQLDWNVVNALDIDALWASVDHMGSSPIAADIERFLDIQAHQLRSDPIMEWSTSGRKADAIPGSDGRVFSSRALHDDYIDWCRKNGVREPRAIKYFSIELVKRGWELITDGQRRFIKAPVAT